MEYKIELNWWGVATLAMPSYGYGIRYEYGIFAQKIDRFEQVWN